MFLDACQLEQLSISLIRPTMAYVTLAMSTILPTVSNSNGTTIGKLYRGAYLASLI